MTSEAQQLFRSFANDVNGYYVVISVKGQPVAASKSNTINGIEFTSFGTTNWNGAGEFANAV